MISTINVYSETNDRRRDVGVLTRDGRGFEFRYQETWLEYKGAIEIGPDLKLSPRVYKSPILFESFAARIPSRSSANYARYCKERNIDVNESDILKLLGTIGHKGASSLVFEIANSPDRVERIAFILERLIERFSLRLVSSSLNLAHSSLQNFRARHAPDSLVFNYIEASFQSHEAFAYRLSLNQKLSDKSKLELGLAFHAILKDLEASSQPIKS